MKRVNCVKCGKRIRMTRSGLTLYGSFCRSCYIIDYGIRRPVRNKPKREREVRLKIVKKEQPKGRKHAARN